MRDDSDDMVRAGSGAATSGGNDSRPYDDLVRRGALVAAIASFFQVNLVIQVLLFLVISLVLLIFTRPWAIRFMNSNREKTNVDSLIGESAVILEKVDNLKETGKAQVRGMEWTVRTEKDEETVEKGEVVTIVKVQGVKLIVKRRKEEIL